MRKLISFIFLLSSLSISVFSQTEVSGNQSGIWSYTDSPYFVVGDISVPVGTSLTIEPGVIVNFQGNYKLNVAGSLQAVGLENDSIVFTTEDIATGWHGIRLLDSQNGSNFAFCRIEYGKTMAGEYPDQHGGGVMIMNSDAVFTDCTFSNNDATADDSGMGGAIYAFNTTSDTHFTHCYFLNNHAYGEGGAIKFSGDNGAVVERCRFFDNSVLYGGGAICLYGCYDTRINKSLFTGNTTNYASGGVALIEGYSSRVVFANCTMIDNHASGGDGGGVNVVYSEASFTNCIIYDNPGAYSDDVYLEFGYAEINYCNTVLPDGAEGSHNINVDAQFEDAANGNYHLMETSPCIDAGIDSLTISTAFGDEVTTVDYDASEYVGSAPDMGSYEYGMVTGLVKTPQEDVISVYPNPTTGILRLKMDQQQSIQNISIRDLIGKLIMADTPIHNQTLDLSNLGKGTYLINIRTNKHFFVKKIEIQ
jgi:hypothetical protein